MRGTISTLDADQEVIQEGDRPSACCLILDGFTFSSKLTKSGKRQIVSLHVPGVIPDLQSLHLEVMDHRLATLAPSRLCFLQHETVHDLIRRCPRIGDALWRETLIDGAIFREWMLSLGQRDAYGRLAHLLCELYVRLHAVGRTSEHSYALPLTQAKLGNVLGLTEVHVNRTLQKLRQAKLITFRQGRVRVLDWARLQEAAEFDPTYLQLRMTLA